MSARPDGTLSDGAAGGGTHIAAVPKRHVRARFLAELQQHVPAVLTVVTAGVTGLRSGHGGWELALSLAQLGVGAWVAGTVVAQGRHLRGLHRGTHPADAGPNGVEWSGLAAAALGYVEVWDHAVRRGHFTLVSPYMLGATTTLVLALGGRRWIRARMRRRGPHLHVSPEGVTYRSAPFRRWTAAWDEVAAVAHAPGTLTLRLRDGRERVLRAADHLQGDALLAAASDAVAAYAPPRLAGGLPAGVVVSAAGPGALNPP